MKENFVVGFTTSHGLMLDLDNTSLRETRRIAQHYCKRFKLGGYLIAKSSQNNYHIIFNRYLSWKKVLEFLFKIVWAYHYHKRGIKPSLTNWAILQACKGSMTLRISNKKHKKPPKFIEIIGLKHNLIHDYCNFRVELNES